MATAKRFFNENMARIVINVITILVLGVWYTALGYSRIGEVEHRVTENTETVIALEQDIEYIQKEIMETLHTLQIDTAILKEQVTYLAEEAKEND